MLLLLYMSTEPCRRKEDSIQQKGKGLKPKLKSGNFWKYYGNQRKWQLSTAKANRTEVMGGQREPSH